VIHPFETVGKVVDGMVVLPSLFLGWVERAGVGINLD